MSPDIELEVGFLIHSFLMGIVISFLYDILRILRRIIPHNILAVSLEDLAYWIACSLMIFSMLIRENNGVLRWFAIVGASAGMFLYKKTLGNLFVKYISLLIQRLLHLVGKILNLLFRPLQLVGKRIEGSGKKSGKWLKIRLRRLKKKLTERRKVLRIILHKR